ncbi:PadR family transcriptional regulator [Bacillus sp. S/N-304-OC-R1]|uniref:PadR family transcriptional regulator n=1 Tax=Bacillus sp. S/N-304-OC-R1 TaxID=2758034 RepID=UPI001C8D0D2C|nr:PadR family transcriptional regulator [Bacillus sp. S/N-304-OC-R1]MBY0121514.1 PadR family transcriptional regulator [Bacillus sp. S/N-304-OC-R1]
MVRLIILGMLKMRPLSGYEIQQVLQMSQTEVWAGILPGSIYHALKKMDKEGLVEVDSVEQTGHRIKAIYKITEKGQLEFLELLKTSLKEKSVGLPGTLYAAISFLHELPAEEKVGALKEQIELLQKELDLLKTGLLVKEQHVSLNEIAKLQFENMFSHYHLQIDFLEKLIAILEKTDGEQADSITQDFQKYFE